MKDDAGQQYLNVYYFKAQAGGTPTAEDLNNAFNLISVGAIMNALHNSMTCEKLETFNLINPADFHTLPISTSGARTGEFLPNSNCWAFQLVRPTRDVRNGRKSYGRIAETDCVNGEATSTGATPILPILTTLASQLALIQFVPSTGLAGYKICIPHSVLTAGKYVLDTLFEASSVAYKRVSTQVSRKVLN